MCGIAGICRPQPDPQLQILAEKAGAAILHRGPDGSGEFHDDNCALIHQRLSIIDLETGGQPLFSEVRDIALVCNGEIYNYRNLTQQLEAKGHHFRSKSDSEVVLHLYQDGIDRLRDLRGMYAAAIWDSRKKTLVLCRDRIGIKPLYYAILEDGGLVFASEIKAILATGLVNAHLEPRALHEYLSFKFNIGETTFFQGIYALQPGHNLVWKNGRVEINQYWMPDLAGLNHNENSIENRFEVEFRDSIDHHLVSDVPVGAFLSGGLDTSVIVKMASELYPGKLQTYTCGTADEVGGDLHFSRIVSRRCGTEHHEVIQSAEEFGDFMKKCLWFLDEPGGGSTAIHGYYVAKRAREDVKVLLSGEGADEILGGYYHYWVQYYRSLPLLKRMARYGSWKQWGGIAARARGECFLPHQETALQIFAQRHAPSRHLSSSSLTLNMVKDLEGYNPLAAVAKLLPEQSGVSTIRQTMWLDLKTYLYRILHIYDRMCMAVGLENRVPFLDHKFVEYAVSLPPEVLFSGMQTKSPLRGYLAGQLGKDIAYRPKAGFTLPVDKWFRNELRIQVESLIVAFKDRGILKPESIENTWQGVLAGNVGREDIWRLISLELWHQNFIDV